MEGLLIGLLFVALLVYGWRTGFSDGRDENGKYTFSHKGIFGLRDLFGLPNGLTGLGRVDAIITQDEFSDKVVTAYQEGRENDVAMDITEEVVKVT